MSTPLLPIPLPGPLALEPRRADDAVKVRELAHEFEGMLLVQMLRQMRQSIDLGGMDGEESVGFGREVMTDTIDVELARQLSLAGGIGVADVIVEAFEKQQALAAEAAARAAQGGVTPPAQVPLHVPDAGARPAQPPPAVEPVPAVAETTLGTGPVSAVGTMGVAPSTLRDADSAAVLLPVASAVTSRFGWRSDPFTGRARFHGGVDVRAAYGTAVPSAAAGRVVKSGEQGAYGLTVVVEHASGLQTRYAHLSASLVREGDVVAVGQPLGRVGSSGRSTGPHLHFEVLVDGRRMDPERAAERFRLAGGFKLGGEAADSSLGGGPSSATEE
jgi:murein DD-endopeptidase MepM/ murein hydrolase activator NlpD